MKIFISFLFALSCHYGVSQEKPNILKDDFGYTESTPHDVALEKLISGCPKADCIPSIDRPQFLPANQAIFMKDEDWVLGLVQNGIEKAYPIKIISWHEIINDEFGKDPILVSYCPLCGSGVAYKRTIQGMGVEFGVSGILYNSNLVMYDRVTRSLWDQIEGKAIVGGSTGLTLEMVPLSQTTWKIWREQHPNTLVLSEETGFNRDYTKNPYADYDKDATIRFPVEHLSKLLYPKARVFGLQIGGEALAIKEDWLRQKKSIKEKLGKKKLEISYHGDGSVTAVDEKTGEVFVANKMFWFAWSAFHPDTKLRGTGKKGFIQVDKQENPAKPRY